MSNIAILGHATRGKEVIEILEMLGGVNTHNLYGDKNYAYYTIDSDKEIKGGIYIFGDEDLSSFALEEFEEKFPYKVGDKVIDIKTDRIVEIYKVHWSESNNCTYYGVKRLDNTGCVRSYKFLQPYKKETMDKVNKAVFDANAQCCDIMNRLIKEETMEEIIKIDIPKGYEFFGVDDNDKIVLTKKQSQYPKTFIECVKILDCFGAAYIDGYKCELLENLQELLVCRDAYWKIAGEEMGLGKPWRPDWNNISDKYCVYFVSGDIWSKECQTRQCPLAFPTAEMRDAFLENFRDLIELCKELL